MTPDATLSNCTYNFDYRECVKLEDGTEVTLRLLRPEDRDQLRQGFQQLSEESKYRRFLGAKSRLSDRELEYLVDVDQYDHVAIGAELDEDGSTRGVGVARCVRLGADSKAAEAAVTVVDDLQGKGLGRILLRRLVAAARERGIETFRATLFAANRSMKALLEEIGEAEIVERDGPVVTLAVALEPEPAQRAAPEEEPRTPLRRILALTGRGAASLVDTFNPSDSED